jgi:hypothetical protein
VKATFQIPDALYRELKIETAREGLTMSEVTISLFEQWLRQKKQSPAIAPPVDWLNFPAPLAHLVSEDIADHRISTMRKSITRNWNEQP